MNDPYSQASAILNQVAPEGERLAYINPYEEALLRAGVAATNISIEGTNGFIQ